MSNTKEGTVTLIFKSPKFLSLSIFRKFVGQSKICFVIHLEVKYDFSELRPVTLLGCVQPERRCRHFREPSEAKISLQKQGTCKKVVFTGRGVTVTPVSGWVNDWANCWAFTHLLNVYVLE